MNRITFGRSVLSAAATAAIACKSAAAAAESYPDRPITMIVPWGAGGGSDQMGRAAAKVLQDELNVSVPVIDVPGANGNDGMLKLIEADADGYTIAVFVGDTFVGNLLSATPPAWTLKDIVPLAVMNRQPFAYYVAQNGAFKSWSDVEKAARSRPFKVGLSGFGGAEDTVTKFFASKGFKFVGIPFPKPGERYAAVLGGQVDMMCDPDGNVRRYVESGQFRAVMVFNATRVPQIPYAQTAKELGYDVVLLEWRALVAKAGTSPERIRLLSDALGRAYKSRDFQQFVKGSWSAADSYVPASDVSSFFTAQAKEIKTLVAATPRS